MIPSRLHDLLKRNKVPYEIVIHPWTSSAQETAQIEFVSGKQVAKVVMVKAEGQDLMIVIPASSAVDLFKLSMFLDTKRVRIEEEEEFLDLFPDCETGAMPPFGKLYKIPCLVDESLLDGDKIWFNAGNHKESIVISTENFKKVCHAEYGDFSVPAHMIHHGWE